MREKRNNDAAYGSFRRLESQLDEGEESQIGGIDSPALNPRVHSWTAVTWQRVRRFLRGGNIMLVLALFALVGSRSVDQTLYYRMSHLAQNYLWYLSTIVLPIAYLAICIPVVAYKLLFTNDITPQMRQIPHKTFAIMGLLDTLNSLLSTWPIPYVKGTIVNVLSNAVLPMTMVGSILWLKTRYRGSHYLGATLVVYGIMVRLLPSLFLQQSDPTDQNSPHYAIWLIVLIISNVPGAASNVYKELALKDSQSDVWYMNCWIGVYQFLWGIVTIPTVALPFPAPAPIIHFQDFGHYLSDASNCVLGKNSQPGDDCADLLAVFCVFIVFNITYNQLMLFIFREGSAVLFTIASAARLPCVDLLLLSSFIAGPATVNNLSVFDWYALFILVIGIYVYYSQKEVHQRFQGDTTNEYEETNTLLASPRGGQGKLHNIKGPLLEEEHTFISTPAARRK